MKIVVSSVFLAGITGLSSIEVMAYQPAGFHQVRYVQPYRYYPQNHYWHRPVQYPYAYRRWPAQTQTEVQAVSPDKLQEQRFVSAKGSILNEVSPGKSEDREQRSMSVITEEKQPNQTKLEFLEQLRPLVIEENRRLMKLRVEISNLIERLESGTQLKEQEGQRLALLAKQYRVEGDPREDSAVRSELLERIDIIPVSLALAQAATESGWGRSRFAREGKNLFGIWTYDATKGLVPKQRAAGKTHLVRKFDSLGESLRYYMHNLNSHSAYADLRRIRSEKRKAGVEPEGLSMAEGLELYSAQGKKYIELIQRIIRQNDLALLDGESPRA